MYPHGIPWLADQLRGIGLKLGLWIVRGVPRQAVEQKLPIFGTNYTADRAVVYDRNCSWNSLTYGGTGPAAAAYYRSLSQQMASWGVAFIKIDCMWPNKYEGTPQTYFDEDVALETSAFTPVGNLTISLSPGISVSPANGTWVASHGAATLYRIAEDVYNGMPDGTFPQGVHQKLTKALEYESLLGVNSTWPDFDMLMVGRTIHSYGAGQLPPTETHLTRDEQTTAMTLWSITGTPLIIGGRLPLDNDANGTWTLGLLTNAEVLAIHNASTARHSFVPLEAPAMELYGWAATPTAAGVDPVTTRYVTFFNAETDPQQASVTFAQIGLPARTTSVCMRDLWAHTWAQPVGGPVGSGNGFTVGVNAHGARAFLVAQLGSQACTNGLQ